MQHIEHFDQHRSYLFGVAYRMLGSVVGAEDIVQEAYLRWQGTRLDQVEEPRAYLVAIVTRLCIDYLRSARVQREEYVGPWLPEPLVGEPARPHTDPVALAESLSMAFLVLLESLNPTERAVFLLHDVFDYDYSSIAHFVGKSEAACRQIAHRARERVTARRPRFEPEPAHEEELVAHFMVACAQGDLPGLLDVLAADIVLWSDGGGKVPAATRPVQGPTPVAKFILGVLRKLPPSATVRQARINGAPGFITYRDEEPTSVLVLKMSEGRIGRIDIVSNPEKLQALREQKGNER